MDGGGLAIEVNNKCSLSNPTNEGRKKKKQNTFTPLYSEITLVN